MKRFLVLSVIMVGLIFSAETFAFVVFPSDIDIVGVKSVRIVQKKSVFYVEAIVMFCNRGGSDARLSNNKFLVSLGVKGSDLREIGPADPGTIFLKTVNRPSKKYTEVKMFVKIGGGRDAVRDKLIHLVNVFGNPRHKIAIAATGTTKFWSRVHKGWLSAGVCEFNFVYHPEVQREILLE